MKEYVKLAEWSIIEDELISSKNKISESIFSIGNGFMGQRANFEEDYSGESLQGNYLGGVYYPDKTRVGWWKNGYPEYFAKIINATNWIGIDVFVEGERFDLNKCIIENFKRELNMYDGILLRTADATMASGKKIRLTTRRFISLVEKDLGAIEYSIEALNFAGKIEFNSYLDGDVVNSDSNYDEMFWVEIGKKVEASSSYIHNKTKKTGFEVCTAMHNNLLNDKNESVKANIEFSSKEHYVAHKFSFDINKNERITLHKYVSIVSSLYADTNELTSKATDKVQTHSEKGFEELLHEHSSAWHSKWEESDIKIGGDLSAQQAIRFNIFQLYQTYTGENENLNIGPKGFTGEKYGGVTYWDTEAYCLPFYMRTADHSVARNLLKYRYNHLEKAQQNALKLGFNHGAALYPMVTINGEECHNEWEITFEEIHRNGAIAYAIYNYIQYTGDTAYMKEFGLEVLIGISRFWAQRVNWSNNKKKFVLLGVTGPNEYENNVNNNWYTLKLIQWTLNYTIEQLEELKSNEIDTILQRTSFAFEEEINNWKNVVDNLYFPVDEKRNIFLQQDGFLDKELIPVKDLEASDRPIHQKWSWDRILRSCYIKQADVLQGLYMFENHYDLDTIKRNFDFYEPLTVHESSLSPCIHSIIASKIGYNEKAYEMYLRTARLDLDNINNDTEDGLHITSMGGTWMSIVEGFAGLRSLKNQISLSPTIPNQWEYYEFRIVYRGVKIEIKVDQEKVTVKNNSTEALLITIDNCEVTIDCLSTSSHSLKAAKQIIEN